MDNELEQASESLQQGDQQDKGVALNIPYEPFDHTVTSPPIDPALANFGGNYHGAPITKPGFLEGIYANLQDKNNSARLAHGTLDRTEDYLDGYKDPNFNPLKYKDKFEDVAPQFQSYLLASENEEQMDLRLKRIQHEQWLDDTVKDSSWTQWLVGGALGIGTDPITYIPVIGQIKYASLGKTAVNSIMRNIPGGVAFGLGSSLGQEVDKINGNVKDFLQNSLINSIFATALFAAGPAGSLLLDKMELWNLRSYVADAVNGIGYKIRVNEKGHVDGLHAYDMNGDPLIGESQNAMRVKLAQDKADSAFNKAGFFKIPYIGTAAEKFMSNGFFGSNSLSMLLNPLKTVGLVIDLAYNHGIITKGLAEGKEKPITFFELLAKTHAEIRNEQNQFNAYHMQRNGVTSKNYVAQSVAKGAMYARQKSLETIQAEIGDRAYVSVEQFADEVQEVMRSGEAHAEGSVNAAAAMYKKSMDKYFKDYRIAHNLPEDWLPPITAKEYLMRVYDTNYMNNNLNSWNKIIAEELRNQDNAIIARMKPIRDVEGKIEENKAAQEAYLEQPNINDKQKKKYADELIALKAQKKALEEQLQNDIRSDPKLHILADNWNALSADEANELIALTKRRDIAQKEVDERKKLIADIKAQAANRSKDALINKTVKTAKGNKRKAAIGEEVLAQEEIKLREVEKELEDEERKLQEMVHTGKVNKRFINSKEEDIIKTFRNPNERLRLRDTYHHYAPGQIVDEAAAHEFRMEHAKAYYATIMNQTAEDTVNQVMGHFTGNGYENHLKKRTLMIPDDVLYDGKFMTKDLSAKVANYKTWLARRTHLKNVYRNSSIDGGFEPLLKQLTDEFDVKHTFLNEDKALLQEKLAKEGISADEKAKLQKALEQTEKAIKNNRKDFDKGKTQVQFVYEKMMGISRLDKRAKQIVSSIKSFNVGANLGFLAVSMITDLFSNPLKQGLVPFIQSGVYPTIQSLGGLLKTHDSQSLRETCGALNLALHHVGGTSASRQLDLSTNPFLNLGRIPAALDKLAHFASNVSLATWIDNYLQRVTSAVAQSNVIRHMIEFSEGRLTKADRMWLNRYGLNPEKHSERIVAAFKKDGGGTNQMGGYQSNFWHWDDLEISNLVGDAVFRSTHDTIISANSLDVPMWLDENGFMNMMAPIIRGFKGWAFASLNRYLIPTMQAPDAQKLMGFAIMTASAALVSPTRRMARGEAPYRENQTTESIITEILLDSPQFAWLSESFSDANMLTGGTLLKELKNDKYYDRSIMGILGPTGSNANKLYNFLGAMTSGNMNERDVMNMVSMLPIANTLYGYQAAHALVSLGGLPKHRAR